MHVINQLLPTIRNRRRWEKSLELSSRVVTAELYSTVLHWFWCVYGIPTREKNAPHVQVALAVGCCPQIVRNVAVTCGRGLYRAIRRYNSTRDDAFQGQLRRKGNVFSTLLYVSDHNSTHVISYITCVHFVSTATATATATLRVVMRVGLYSPIRASKIGNRLSGIESKIERGSYWPTCNATAVVPKI